MARDSSDKAAAVTCAEVARALLGSPNPSNPHPLAATLFMAASVAFVAVLKVRVVQRCYSER